MLDFLEFVISPIYSPVFHTILFCISAFVVLFLCVLGLSEKDEWDGHTSTLGIIMLIISVFVYVRVAKYYIPHNKGLCNKTNTCQCQCKSND